MRDDYILYDLNIPKELKGMGIGSLVFKDAISYFKVKKPNFKGIKAEWQGDNPNYEDGASDNFKLFKEALKLNKTEKEAAFETWTGKQALKKGFKNANVVDNDDKLVIVEFTE